MKQIVMVLMVAMCLVSGINAQETFVDTLEANKDSFTDANFTTNNYGLEDFLTLYHDGVDPIMTMFIGFDLTEIMESEEELVLDKATLILDATHVSEPADMQLAAVADEWDEGTINYDNQPDIMEDGIDTVTLDNSGLFMNDPGFFQLDATETILAMWLAKMNMHALRAMAAAFTGTVYSFDFNSRNKTSSFNAAAHPDANPAYYGPLLIVEYHTASITEEPAPSIEFTVSPVSSGAVGIGFSLPSSTFARLAVYDASGALVETLDVPSGNHSLTWNAGNSGVYFIKLEAGDLHLTRKAIVLP